MKKVCRIAVVLLLVAIASFDGRAEKESTTNVTAILRQAIRQLQKIGCNNPITPENAPRSYHGSFNESRPVVEARCSDVNGRFRYQCSYRAYAEGEFLWEDRIRKIGDVRIFSDIDREPVWNLLDRAPMTYAFEDVLNMLGKPYRSHMLRCENCGGEDMRWEYVAYGRDDYGEPIRHTLTFSFSEDGKCTGWVWLSEGLGDSQTILRRGQSVLGV